MKYTGRPIDEAHMHLGISPPNGTASWPSPTRHSRPPTCRSPRAVSSARSSLASSSSAVLPAGAVAPPHPGAPRPHPSAVGTAFARLGGVYPIAQFAARLVDMLVDTPEGRAIGVRFDALDDPNGRRHTPGLTYLLTELLCSAAGGVEVVTAKGFDEARLGVPREQWPAVCALAAEAATFFPTAHHRQMALSILTELRTELWWARRRRPRRRLATARIVAAGLALDAIAALAQSEGADKAVELLLKGWRPEAAAADAAAEAAAAALQGPFGHGGGSSQGGEAAAASSAPSRSRPLGAS